MTARIRRPSSEQFAAVRAGRHDIDLAAEERFDLALAARLTTGKGWRKAAVAARLRLTSRAHALALLPTLMKNKDGRGVRFMVRHGLGA